MPSLFFAPVIILPALVALVFLANEIGFQIGRRGPERDEEFKKQLGFIRGATLALFSFLVGFSFSGAGSRYIDRQDMIVKEANAIGTAWLRAMVLPEPQRSGLQTVLRDYAANRVALIEANDKADISRLMAEAGRDHVKMWDIALKAVAGEPQLMRIVLPPLNDVIDLHTSHLSAAQRHIPTAILAVLIACGGLAFVLVGYGAGLTNRRFPILNSIYGVIAAAALWMTIDLDHPRHGLIRSNLQPYTDLIASMKV